MKSIKLGSVWVCEMQIIPAPENPENGIKGKSIALYYNIYILALD